MPKKPSKTPADSPEEHAIQYLAGNNDVSTKKEPIDEDGFEILEEGFELLEENRDIKELEDELDLELAGMAGKIIESKPIDNNLLAKIEVEKNNLGHREGTYLILKTKGKAPVIFGGKHADKLDQKTIDITYTAIESAEQFLEMGAEYMEGIDMERQTRLKKLRRELFTISGIIKKHRFLGHNLLALIKIDKELQEAAFGEEKTDPKRLQMALIGKGEQIDCIEGLRDGIYAVLSKGEAGMKVLGGKGAYRLDPEVPETIYQSIKNPAHFFDADNKLKKYIKDLEADVNKEIETKARELEKIMSELDEPITIEGETPEIPDSQLEEELGKLKDEINELEIGEEDD